MTSVYTIIKYKITDRDARQKEISKLVLKLKKIKNEINKADEANSKLTEEIIDLIEKTNDKGVTFNGKRFEVKVSTKRRRKKLKDKNEAIVKILESEGVEDTNNVLKSLNEAKKGELYEEKQLISL